MSGRLLEEQCPRLAHPHRRFISDACIAGESCERGKASSNIVLLFLYLICAGPYKAFLNISREAPHHGGNIAIQNRDMPCEKQRLRTFLTGHVSVLDCDIATVMWRFPRYVQKGFIGTCTYQIQEEEDDIAASLTTLAAFARYAGIGYKTTMGMAQPRPLLPEQPPTPPARLYTLPITV